MQHILTHGSVFGIYFTNRQWLNCKKAVSIQSLATANNVYKLEKPAIIRKTLCQIQILKITTCSILPGLCFICFCFCFFCSQNLQILRNDISLIEKLRRFLQRDKHFWTPHKAIIYVALFEFHCSVLFLLMLGVSI